MVTELPAGHPLASPLAQAKFLGGLAVRWFGAAIVGVMVKLPIISLLLALGLFHLWFRKFRNRTYWLPYGGDYQAAPLWMARVALLAISTVALLANWNDIRIFPFVMGWVGICLALLIESFLVPPILTASKDSK